MKTNQKLIYKLEWYKKEGDDFIVGNYILPEELIPSLRELLNLEPDDPMIYDYSLSSQQVVYLQQYLEHEIDLNQYDYLLA